MKRIEEPKQERSLKPIYNGSRFSRSFEDSGPYYDPLDIHVHVYKNLQTSAQNHMEPVMKINNIESKASNIESKASIEDCEYCIICHKANPKISLSTSKIRSIHDLESFKQTKETSSIEAPCFLNSVKISSMSLDYINKQLALQVVAPKQPLIPYTNSKLFMENEGIFQNYVKISDVINHANDVINHASDDVKDV